MGILKNSFNFYSRHIESFMLLAFTIMLPLLIVELIVTNYVYEIYRGTLFTIYGDISNAYMMLFVFVMSQLPFIKYIWSELEGEERRIAASYVTFFEFGLSLFLFALVYVAFIVVGSMMLIIPGIIVLVLFFLTPYIIVYKNKTARKSWIEAFRLGKKKFFPLLGIILSISLIEWLISFVILSGISRVTNNYGALVATQMIVTMIVFPFLVTYITLSFRKWQGLSTN